MHVSTRGVQGTHVPRRQPTRDTGGRGGPLPSYLGWGGGAVLGSVWPFTRVGIPGWVEGGGARGRGFCSAISVPPGGLGLVPGPGNTGIESQRVSARQPVGLLPSSRSGRVVLRGVCLGVSISSATPTAGVSARGLLGVGMSLP